MSEKILSVPLPEAEERELERIARELGRSPSETGSLLIQEGLRRHQFADLEFRQTPTGRYAYIAGTRLPVWQIVQIASRLGGDSERTAQHLCVPVHYIETAQNYARTYPDEIRAAIEHCENQHFEELSQILPGLRQ